HPTRTSSFCPCIWLTDKKGGVPSRTPQIGLYSLWDNRFPRRVNMEGTPRLYDTLVQVLSQHQNWVDRRHLKTLACMVAGLIQAGKISLTAWVPYVHSRAVYAQSTVRRFARCLENPRIDVHSLYGPLIQQSLAEWDHELVYLAV